MVVITAATAATAAKLVLSACTLIATIIQEAGKSSEKIEDCRHLAGRLSSLRNLLLSLQQEAPELVRELALLRDTLNAAHKLVVDCRKWKVRNLTLPSILGARFAKINSRIDSHVIDITAHRQVGMKGCSHSTTLAATTSRSLAGLFAVIIKLRFSYLLFTCIFSPFRFNFSVANEQYGQRIRTRDLIKGSARMLIGK